jgi:hypothetical protein
MTERTRAPIIVSATRIGRTDLGPGRLVIDDDAITLSIGGGANERHFRIPCSSMDALSIAEIENELTFTLRDATRLTIVTPLAAELRTEILGHCRALPELTRALRAFGSRRGHRGTRHSASTDQRRFFAPLLAARRDAGTATDASAVLNAFDAAALRRAVEEALQSFAVERYAAAGPGRRALEAELIDLAEPLMLAIEALGAAGASATASLDDLRLWRLWAAQLRVTFEVADRVWLSLDVALDATPWPT